MRERLFYQILYVSIERVAKAILLFIPLLLTFLIVHAPLSAKALKDPPYLSIMASDKEGHTLRFVHMRHGYTAKNIPAASQEWMIESDVLFAETTQAAHFATLLEHPEALYDEKCPRHFAWQTGMDEELCEIGLLLLKEFYPAQMQLIDRPIQLRYWAIVTLMEGALSSYIKADLTTHSMRYYRDQKRSHFLLERYGTRDIRERLIAFEEYGFHLSGAEKVHYEKALMHLLENRFRDLNNSISMGRFQTEPLIYLGRTLKPLEKETRWAKVEPSVVISTAPRDTESADAVDAETDVGYLPLYDVISPEEADDLHEALSPAAVKNHALVPRLCALPEVPKVTVVEASVRAQGLFPCALVPDARKPSQALRRVGRFSIIDLSLPPGIPISATAPLAVLGALSEENPFKNIEFPPVVFPYEEEFERSEEPHPFAQDIEDAFYLMQQGGEREEYYNSMVDFMINLLRNTSSGSAFGETTGVVLLHKRYFPFVFSDLVAKGWKIKWCPDRYRNIKDHFRKVSPWHLDELWRLHAYTKLRHAHEKTKALLFSAARLNMNYRVLLQMLNTLFQKEASPKETALICV